MPYTNMFSGATSYQYIVTGDGYGPFSTIQQAIDQAEADRISGAATLPIVVFVRPGTYTEDLTLYNDINIEGSSDDDVTIVGTHVPPATGVFTITKVTLESLTHAFSSAAAGNTEIIVKDCLFKLTNGYVFNMTNWTGDLLIDLCEDLSTSNHIVINTAGAALDITDSNIGSGVAAMVVSGVTHIFNSQISCPATFAGTSATLIDGASRLNKAITTAGTAEVDFVGGIISTGAAIPITHNSTVDLVLNNVVVNTNNPLAIDGTGPVAAGEVVFPNSHGIAGTITYTNTSELQCSNLLANNGVEVTLGDVTITNGQLILGVASGTNGQVPIAATGANPAWATITSTDGTINIALGANTIDLSSAGGANWQVATAATAMVATDGYITKIAIPGILNYTLPVVSPLGTILEITGYSAGLWAILQGAGQQIHFGNVDTTLGAGGSITATNRYDSIRLLCVTADTEWNVLSSTGVFNIV